MHSHRPLTVVLALVLLAACAGGPRQPAGGAGGASPAMAVERFLQLAAERDYVEMGWVFGNQDGAIIRQHPRSEVERRMYAIATVLQHEAFVAGPGSPVPGRIGSAERFTVKLHSGQNEYDVPFIVVRGPGGRWFVEQVDLQAVTSVG